MRFAPYLWLVTGCFDPKFNNPACGPAGECPSGLVCIAGTCRAPVDGDIDAIDAPPDMMIDTPPGSVTVTYQQGTNGYQLGRDTYLEMTQPAESRGTQNPIRWRSPDRFAMIAFDGIVAPGQIPQNATILAATLRLVINQDNADGELHEIAVDWNNDVSYNTFGPTAGVQTTDYGLIVPTPILTAGPKAVDVKATLQRWANGAPNYGWIMLPLASGGGESSFRGNEDGVMANRPSLTVTFFP